MKTKPLVSLLTIACSAVAFAQTKEAAQLQIYPKNLARQHVGTNLFIFKPATQTFVPSEASAAWLDDDVTTGWPMLAGKQYYLLSFPQPELINNFSLSARPASGTVTLYAGDEPAAPGAKSWTVLSKDIPFEKINEHKLSKPLTRTAKYILIETDVADPGPVYSLFAYTDKPAVAYNLQKREQSIDSHAVFGPYTNQQTAFNLAGLYAGSTVSHADSANGFVSWQKAVDDNPETGVTLTPSADRASATLRYQDPRSVSRIALLTDPGTKGKFDFYLVDQPAGGAATSEAIGDRIPTVSVVMDGTSNRNAIDFPAIQSSEMLVRWTPANGTDSVNVREVNTFGTPTLDTYAVNMKPEAVAEFGGNQVADASKDGKDFKDSKDSKDAKEAAEPIGQFLPQRGPYLPGALGFPPNLTNRRPVVLPPNEVVSP